MNTVSIYQYEANHREPGIGNREVSPCSLFGHVIQMCQKCKSGISNQFPVPF